MATGVLPKPGSKYGPCLPDCFTEGKNNERPIPRDGDAKKHTDCEENEVSAVKVCRLCSKPIGYGVRFYVDPLDAVSVGALVHEACLEDDRA